ncbi:PRC-barrel domain-containing protein [Mesonia ostreae]|uniref:PRC-barrel domain-containing protein n=1 Tax=Mesonia ostreae TaxID=861110 RepID=A0ABU2KIN0_9FLAO|nr:PRC-barrel domain-containing protein [Mesonia ostreae]MDT0294534.1 PRC-barrel domain-containing protein [Mesonia ostreae]
MDKKNKNLYYLNELSDYTVEDGYSDVRGWEVKDKDHRVIGKVDSLLVNKNSERVVYLDVEVEKSIIEANHKPYGSAANKDDVHEFLNDDGENHLIIPIGLARLNEDDKVVYSDKINHQTFAETKRVKPNTPIDRTYENNVLRSYNREHKEKYPEDDSLYERGEFTPRNE